MTQKSLLLSLPPLHTAHTSTCPTLHREAMLTGWVNDSPGRAEKLCHPAPPHPSTSLLDHNRDWGLVTHRCCSGLWLRFFQRNPEPWVGSQERQVSRGCL